MKNVLYIIALLISYSSYSQSDSLLYFNSTQADSIISKELKIKFNIKHPIYRVYPYQDKAGEHLLVLTEQDLDSSKVDSTEAFFLLKKENVYIQTRKVIDFTLADGNPNSEEFSMWFFTKYLRLSDVDDDGLVDPILVYGTNGLNNLNGGRIKILCFHKGRKRAIRHQNGDLDSQRFTSVDSGFYHLPTPIQILTKALMVNMTKNDHAIFPYGWENAMDKRSLYFDERN